MLSEAGRDRARRAIWRLQRAFSLDGDRPACLAWGRSAASSSLLRGDWILNTKLALMDTRRLALAVATFVAAQVGCGGATPAPAETAPAPAPTAQTPDATP